MAYTKQQIIKAKEKIIKGLYEGKSLKSILDNDKELPSRPRIYEWLNENHDKYDKVFRNNYAYAREESSDIDADKIEELNQELRDKQIDPATARVIADNLKWMAGKKKPTKYGDKLEIKQTNINEEPTEAEIDARINELTKKDKKK